MSGVSKMAESILVDTDVLIDAGRGLPEALDCLMQAKHRASLSISAITHMELIIGCRNKGELCALEGFVSQFRRIVLDERICAQALDLLRAYRLSHGLLIADALVAASAMCHGMPLISKNQRDYHFIVGLQLLPYPDASPA